MLCQLNVGVKVNFWQLCKDEDRDLVLWHATLVLQAKVAHGALAAAKIIMLFFRNLLEERPYLTKSVRF